MTEARRLGRFGVWRSASLVTPELAAGIERLGFGALWLGSSPPGDLIQAEELLDATTTLTLATSLVLAALGPRVLGLARDRAAGAIPYLVPPEHTRQARAVLGPGPLLAPEHKVVLDTDPDRARALGRTRVQRPYLGLVNYTSNLRRLGWSEEDLSGSGSDALIDALVAHGSPADVARQLTRHLDAGADHVCVQLITEEGADPLPGYSALAPALGLS